MQPNWSPHGKRIAYWGTPSQSGWRDLWSIAPGGGQPVAITNDRFQDWNPVWAPDGRHLYFSSDRGGSMNLWRVPIDEDTGRTLGPPEPLSTPSPYGAFASISRDGKTLAYMHQFRLANLQRTAFDPVTARIQSQPAAVTRGTMGAGSPDSSADGEWLTFASTDKQEDIFIVRPDGTGLKQLTNDAHKDRFPRWSPDGKRVVFYSNRSGKNQVWAVNVESGALEQVTYAERDVVAPKFSRDGKRLVYYSNQEKKSWLLDPARPWKDQTPEVLPPFAFGETDAQAWFGAWDFSSDGRKLAGHRLYPGGTIAGIVVYTFATKKYELLAEKGIMPVWMKDSRRLLYYDRDTIYLLDTQTKRPRPVLSVTPHRIVWNISISPDNRAIYFSLVAEETDIWLAKLQ